MLRGVGAGVLGTLGVFGALAILLSDAAADMASVGVALEALCTDVCVVLESGAVDGAVSGDITLKVDTRMC